nr:VPg [Blackcurrant reversion virus]
SFIHRLAKEKNFAHIVCDDVLYYHDSYIDSTRVSEGTINIGMEDACIQ